MTDLYDPENALLGGQSPYDVVQELQANGSQWYYINGLGGSDLYVNEQDDGYGHIRPKEETATSGASDQALFTDLNFSEFIFSTVNSYGVYASWSVTLDMSWSKNGMSGSFQVQNMANTIESFEFADGTVYTHSELLAEAGLGM